MPQGNNKINFSLNFQKGDTAALDSLKKDLIELKRLAGDADFGLDPKSAQQLTASVNMIEQAMSKATDFNLNTINVQKFNNILKQSGTSIKQLQEGLSLAGAEGNAAFLKMTAQLMQFNTATKQTHKFLDSMATTLFNTIKWTVTSNLLNNFINGIEKAYYYTKDLDRSLNDIRIVTGKSADEMSKFADEANKAAKELAVTTEDYTTGALIYYQQGLDDETVKTLTDITAKTSNVTQQSMGTVSEQLTAVWNGYKVANEAAEEGMQVYEEYVDKMAAVGASTASDLEELSTAMSKVASAASNMGVTFDDLNAQIATIVSVTRQAPESVGTALKTIYARLGDLKVDGVDEFGTKLGEVSSQLKTMGIDILDTNGDMRDMSSVMAEVADKWNTWSSAQQQAAAIAMAGKRQYNNLVALFENWDMYGEALETSMNAAGTLEKQQEIALDSLANKMDILSATAQGLYQSLIDEDTIKGFVEGLTSIVDLFKNFSDAVGGLSNLLPLLGATAFRVFNQQIADGLSKVIINMQIAKTEQETMLSNQQALQQMFSESSLFQQSGSGTVDASRAASLQQLTGFYGEMVQYQSIMTQEEKEQYNTILNKLVKVGELNGQLAEEGEYYNTFSNKLNIIDNEIMSKIISNTKLEVNELAKVSKEINTINQITESMDMYGDLGNQNWADYLHQLKELGVELDLDSDIIKRIDKEFIKLGDTGLSFAEVLKIISNELKSTSTRTQSLVQIRTEMDNLKNSTDQAGTSLKNNLNLELRIANMTNLAGAIGQVAFGFKTLSNTINVLKDDSISWGDKILQVFMNLGMTIPTIINSFSKVHSILEAENLLLFKRAEANTANTAATMAETAAIEANKAAKASELAISQLHTADDEKELALIFSKITAEEMEAIATEKLTAEEVLNNIANKEGIFLDQAQLAAGKAQIVAKNAETAATKAQTLATQKATLAQTALNTVMSINPIGAVIVVLTALAAALGAVYIHYENVRKAAKETAEEASKQAEEINNEAKANKELINSYEDVYEQYKQGNATKAELWETTDKLINAYDLESARIHVLQGDYEAFARAIRQAREEEEEEIKIKNKRAYDTAIESVAQTARKGVNGIKVSGNNIRVDTGDLWNSFGEEGVAEGLKIYEDIFGTTEQIINIDKTESLEFYNKLLKYKDELQKQGAEGTAYYNGITDLIKSFEADGAIDNLIEAQKNNIDAILNSSHLEEITNAEEFNQAIESMRTELGEFLSPDDVDKKIISFVGSINNSLANHFIIEEQIKQKFGDEVTSLLQDSFYKYDEATQAGIIGLGFDFSTLNTFEGKELLEKYAQFITGNQNGIYYIPVSFQDQINDTVLKGKDISKGDWTSMLSTISPEGSAILGDREEFNNKSIGERIALLQQVNELNKQNNLLAIQQYDINKSNSQAILDSKKQEEEYIQTQVESKKNLLEQSYISQETKEKIQQDLQDLQQRLKEIEDEKYTIEIALDMDVATDNLVQSIVGDVMTSSDQIKAAAESIGAGWTVAAEDVATFAAAFPELMEGMERLEDGSLQLSKEVVNAALESSQAQIKADKQVAIEAAENKIKQLKLELQFKEEQEKILTEALEGHKTAEETKTALADAAFNYQTQLLDNGLIAEADALTKAQIQEQTAVDGMIGILGGLNEAINTIHHNFANMLTTDADMLSLDAVAGSVKQITSSSVDVNKLNNNGFDTSDIDAMIAARDKLNKEISQTKSQIASYEGFVSEMMNSVSEMDKAADRVQKGLAGKEDKSKSGGNKKKDKDEKKLDEEFDRYWEIKKAIDAVDTALSRLDKKQEKLYGRELINSLKVENQLLEQQAANYEALAAAQREEAAELQGVLAGYGMTFDASGAITNYAAATAAALAEYNNAIAQYNAGLINETTLGVYEKNYEAFKKALQRYETLYYTEMKNTQEKLEEIKRKQLENNLKAWEVEIQLKLDMKELKRQWNDFIRDVTKDFQKVYEDLRVGLKTSLKDAKTYIGKEGTIDTILKAIKDVMHEIDIMEGGGESSMFESISQAQEKLKELNDQMLDSAKALHDLWEEAWDAYLDGIDQVSDKFDDLMERFERIDDELEFQKQIIELLYGEEAYGLMDKLFKGQEHNLAAQIDSLKQQKDMWEDLFYASGATLDNQADWTADQQKYYENWVEAQGKLNDSVVEYIKLLKDDYLNTIKDVLKQFENMVTNGSGLDYLNDQWDRISDRADKYFDSVEKTYKIQQLANKMDEDINKMSNVKNQQKLQELREREIEYLREKETLTQYDLDAAEARYQIALKEAALEDAQNNKTSMKLTRNEQGNWSYQYIADEGDVASKQQELLDAYSKLYQLASDAYEANLESLINLQQDFLDKAHEIAESEVLTEEQKQEQLQALRVWYDEEYRLLAGENALYRDELTLASSELILQCYEQDEENYKYMTETEKALLQELLNANIAGFLDLEDKLKTNYNNIKDSAEENMAEVRDDWKSKAQDIAALWNADSGFSVKVEVQNAYDAIDAATKRYQELVDECAKAVERDFSEEGIAGAIKKAEDETDNLKDKTADMVTSSISYLNDLKKYVDQIAAAWKSVQQQIMNAISLIEEYLKKIGELNAAANSGVGGGNGGNGGGNGGDGNGGNKGGNAPVLVSNQVLTATADGKWFEKLTYSDGSSETRHTGRSYYDKIGQKKGTFKTGGYTGSWGDDSGRLAVLHQKELVLNADDTKNFLSGIKMMRDMTDINGSIEKAIARSVVNMASSVATSGTAGIGYSNTRTNNENNTFNITAEFPNANDVEEIRQAILTLPNYMSQYVNRNTI